MYLKDIAEVIPGYTFRGAIKADSNGNTFVFQARDLVQGEPFTDSRQLVTVLFTTPGYSSHIRMGDVLIIARGMKSGPFRSTVFASDTSNVVASSSVHVIRLTSNEVLPEYLSHYLNSKDGQDALSQIVSGSYIGALPRKQLELIRIPVPTLKKQNMVIDLYCNIHEQRRILGRKNELNQSVLNATFKHLAV